MFLKRIFDIVFACLGIFAVSPLLFIVSILIAFESKGGVFYLQTRVGLNNVDFKLFKFLLDK